MLTDLLNWNTFVITQFSWADAPFNSIYYPVLTAFVYTLFCVGARQLSIFFNTNNAFEPVALADVDPHSHSHSHHHHHHNHDSESDSEPPPTQQLRPQKPGWDSWFGSDLFVPQIVHNLVLIFSSAFMFTGLLVEITSSSSNLTLNSLTCNPPNQPSTGPTSFFLYLYYLSKYYELLDTFLQLARGKPPPHFALHVYHHACILVLSWVWLEFNTSLAPVGVLFNTLVHVVMYSYYLQRVLTCETPKYKKLVTLLQLVQFSTSFVLFIFSTKFHFGGGGCSGYTTLHYTTLHYTTLHYTTSFTNINIYYKHHYARRSI